MVETDEEQLEVLKNWWDENGTTLVTTLVLGLAAIFGYRAWEDNVRETGEAASSTYQNLVQATSNLDDENLRLTALNLGEELKNDYEGSTYASFAALHLAKIAVEQGDLAAAQAGAREGMGGHVHMDAGAPNCLPSAAHEETS